MNQELSKAKNRIQSLLRQIVIQRDGGCFLRFYKDLAGECSGYLQADHLISRRFNETFADIRNVICVCQRHHLFWKQQNSRLYYDLVKDFIGERWNEWLIRKDEEVRKKVSQFSLEDWEKAEKKLIKILEKKIWFDEKRTIQQNRALHKWCEMIADVLNENGLTVKKVINKMRKGVELFWTKELVKELLIKEIEKHLFGKISTRDLKKHKEIDKIIEVMNKFLGEVLQIECPPFPSNKNFDLDFN